jgi:hypothetical protein
MAGVAAQQVMGVWANGNSHNTAGYFSCVGHCRRAADFQKIVG